jgi:beta-galactosidase
MLMRMFCFLCFLLFGSDTVLSAESNDTFNTAWRFLQNDESNAQAVSFDDHNWETVTLPHSARNEPLITGRKNPQWQGLCWYRKSFDLPADATNKLVILRFEGAMNVADIWVNGQTAGHFMGGYLPYVLDISKLARPGAKNLVAVRLDNRDNPITGPKPLPDLDFNLYSGLYRAAQLSLKDKLHITDPMLAEKVAGGGIFVTFPQVSKQSATVRVQTNVRNSDRRSRTFALRTSLLDDLEHTVASVESELEPLLANADRATVQELRVSNPKLWSPASPSCYRVRSELVEDGQTVDTENTRIGIRRIEITKDGFRINGDKMFLRGCNRHQEYPYIGNALSDAAQYRDALKIKEAGFDYIRLSHYPQSPAFLDACDELGIVVMDCLMGWQYFGKDPAFVELKLRECREMVRRDRNHPSVILWEVSLNESHMPESFIAKANSIAHEEYPGDQCYTAGWMKGYDVFIQARQHGGCHTVTDMPCLVSEYGDWEYFAQNAGLEQEKWKELKPAERNSRQLRGDGEVRLLQQALNFQEAHNDDLQTPAFAGIWVMFDYNRGYADEIEASGVMDIFRIPKFAWWFFRAQRDPVEIVAGKPVGPVAFIANDWTPASPREVRVFSNCEEVALRLNGKLIERRRPDTGRTATRLKHAPFTFQLADFEPGRLEAVGYLGGREAATHERLTPGKPAKLALRFDLSDKPFAECGKDMVFCYADLLDDAGTLVPTNGVPISLGAQGHVRLLGQNPIPSEAGISATLLQADTASPACAVYALTLIHDGALTRILSAAGSPNGAAVPACTIRYTTDGSKPSLDSAPYQSPVQKTSRIRAALFVADKLVAVADSTESVASIEENSPGFTTATLGP